MNTRKTSPPTCEHESRMPSFESTRGLAADGGVVRCVVDVVDLGARGRIASGLPFLDHMLDQLTAHAQLGVSVAMSYGGKEFEPEKHYSVALGGAPIPNALERDIIEAAGEALGGALRAMLGDGKDAQRFLAPLDEGLAEVVLRPNVSEPSARCRQDPFGTNPPDGRTYVGALRLQLLSGFWCAPARPSASMGLCCSMPHSRPLELEVMTRSKHSTTPCSHNNFVSALKPRYRTAGRVSVACVNKYRYRCRCR